MYWCTHDMWTVVENFFLISLPAWCVGAYTTIRDRQNLACEGNSAGKCADAARGRRRGERVGAYTAPDCRKLVRISPRDGCPRAGPWGQGFKDESEGVDRELLSALMPSNFRRIFARRRLHAVVTKRGTWSIGKKLRVCYLVLYELF